MTFAQILRQDVLLFFAPDELPFFFLLPKIFFVSFSMEHLILTLSSRSSKSEVLSSCNCSRTCVLNEWSDLSKESPLGPPSPLPRTRVDLAHEVSLASDVIFFETISSISLSRPSNYSKKPIENL